MEIKLQKIENESHYDWGVTQSYKIVIDKPCMVIEFLLEWFKQGYDIVGMKNGEIHTNGYELIPKTRAVIFPSNVPYLLINQSQYNRSYDAFGWFPDETLRAKVKSIKAYSIRDNIFNVTIDCKYRLIDKIKQIFKLRIKVC